MIKANILILGETGNGKSSLGNFILNRKEIFPTSNDTNSETKQTIGHYGIGDSKNVFVIDTPGLLDPEGNDKEQFENLLRYTKKQTHLQAIIINFNYNFDRFAEHIKNMIRLLCNAFPQNDFFNHVALVWTKYYYYLTEKQKNKRFNKISKTTQEMIKLIKNENHYPPNNFPCFFIDTDFEQQDYFSKQEVNRLIAWASNLTYLDTNLTKIVNPLISKEEEEFRECYLNQSKYLNKITTYYSQQKRKKQTFYNKIVNYTNWEQYNTRQKVYYEPKCYIGSDIEYKVEKELKEHIYYTYEGGFWRTLFDNLERVRHVEYIEEDVLYKREIKKYNDGTKDIGYWEKCQNSYYY